MGSFKLALAQAAILALCSAMPAHAIECGDPDGAYYALEQQGYQQVFFGDTQNGETMKIYVADQGWIAIVITPDGRACIVGAGPDWGVRGVGEPT